ncbi:uncharacterized protein PV09_03990 [Verruconis gallopava]|uniref:NADH-ubiquinone oxidoreductase B15 subunit n=1 Tax=Verruconis gallopava TaxID=253628 RepID=A0A0D2AEB5_9PEZI|nr:uncharacterized protein PV09_03990 [Verruconis gallopava]KIW04805.1 hypothetical protein PV09_03990 [Verruconis gallopava]
MSPRFILRESPNSSEATQFLHLVNCYVEAAIMRPSLARMGHANTLNMDPALVKYANLYVKRHEYFRWTPRTARIAFMYVIAVPSLIGYVLYKTDGKFELRGKRRGDIMSDY